MNRKFPLYQERNFSEKFAATFDFARENWRVFLRMALYLWLPLCLVQSIFLNSYYTEVFGQAFSGNATSDLPWATMGVLIVVSMISFCMVWGVTYGLMLQYKKNDGDIANITVHDFAPTLKRNFGRMAAVLGIYVLVGVVFVVAVAACSFLSSLSSDNFGSFFLFFLFFLAVLVCLMPPLSLFPAIYLLEDDARLWSSFLKAFRYGLKTWGGLFALLLVFGIILYMASMILVMPGMILAALKSVVFPATFSGSGALPVLYTILQDVVMIVCNFFSWLFTPLMLIAIGFHYGSAAEQLDDITVADDIEHFEQLGDETEDNSAEAPKSDIDNFDNL